MDFVTPNNLIPVLMKKIINARSLKAVLFLMLLMCGMKGWGQVTVFTDDFSTNTSTTYTTSGSIGASVWTVNRSGDDWGARRNSSPAQLEQTNDVGATTNVLGWVFSNTALSGFTAPFNSTLNTNPGIVTWTFNMRTNRTSALAGFTSTNSYGMAFILSSTSNTPSVSGNGYAVVMGGGGTNTIGLIAFTNGLQGTKTTIVGFGGAPAALTNYLSVKVTYVPSTNSWELFNRDDGSSAFTDPAGGTLTSLGTAINNTYTGTNMTYYGAYWQGSTGAAQTTFFDNTKVTVATGCTPSSTQASGLSATSATTSQFNINWTAGDGNGTMIVVRPTAQSLVAPSSGTAYTPNTDYTLAGQINTNNRVVFRAAGTTVTPTNLSAGTQYTATAYEYNTTGDCYNLTSPPSSSIFTLSLEPTAHAASFTATAVTPTSIGLSFAAANTITNGAGYIILQKQGATAPTGAPADATGYSVGNTIGDGTVAAIVTNAAAVSATISSLTASTQYYYTIIPYNWNGTNAATYNYYTDATIPSATATTLSLSAPTIISPTVTAITNTTATPGGNVTSDGGAAVTARGVVWAETSLNSNPTIGGANTTDVAGTGTTGVFTVSATGLPVATQISYAAYATNSQGTSYTTPVTSFYTLANPTTTPSSVILFGTVTTGSIQLSWTNGDGVNRIVVARATATTRVGPSNGVGYTANSADFTDVLNSTTGAGNVVIFNGAGSTVTVTGLTAGTSYTFDIYEYNGATVTANYGANFSGARSTMAAEPTVQATALTFTNVNATSFKINWVLGNGANSLVLVKDVTAVDADPVDGTTYTSNSIFGLGAEIGTGNFVVYKATLATVTISGLTDGHTYHVAVYSFNGFGGTENYLTTSPATGSQLAATATFYSQSTSDPAVLANWNTVRAGGGTSPAAFTDGNFVIQNTHNMTTTAAWSVGATGTMLQIESGGILTAPFAVTNALGSTFKIDGGGSYIQASAIAMGSTIFGGTEVFAAGSNIEIQIAPTGTSSPSAPGWGNLTINQTTGAGAIGWAGVLSSIQGNLTILGTGSGATRHALTAGTNVTTSIGGNFTVTGGNFWLSSGAGTNTVTITGNLVVNGGTLDIANSSGICSINVGGNVTVSSGTLTEGGSTTTSKIVFNKTGTQAFTSGGTISNLVNFEVATGSLTDLGTSVISGTGAVTVNSGGILKVGSLNGTGAIAGNITALGGLILNAGSTVEFNGAAAQFAAARTFSNLIINNAAGVSMNSSSDITVSGTLTLTSGTLSIGSNTLTLNGAVTTTSGTLTGSSSSNLTIGAAAGTLSFLQTSAATRSLNNLTLGAAGAATLGSALDIYGTVGLTAGGSLDMNAQAVTLKSTSTGTTRVADLTGSTLTGASNVTVERFINDAGKRAWRLLSAQQVTGSQTIFDAWQESGAVVANRGVYMTSGGSVLPGFDGTSQNGTSILIHDQTIPSWTSIPVANTNATALSSQQGYMVFVRGDRSHTTTLPTPTAYNTTVLKTTGALKQGTQGAVTVSATGSGRTLVGNPFASPVDMDAIFTGTTNLDQEMYVWDPSLSGNFGVGGFRFVERNGGVYQQTPVVLGGGPVPDANSRYVHSGQAVFLKATGANASVVFAENNKTNMLSVVNPIVNTPGDQQIFANLMIVNPGNVASLADGFRVRFDGAYSTSVTDDAEKMGNFAENISSYRNNKALVVEKRPMIGTHDTIFMRLNNSGIKDYRLAIGTFDFVQTNVTAFLKDGWLNTITGLDLTGAVNYVDFSISADPASANPDRFSIIFAASGPLPVTLTSLKATQTPGPVGQGSQVEVEWKVSNQLNMKQYEVERSTDGVNYTQKTTQPATGINGSDAVYTWIDLNPVVGNNFYRIRMVGFSGDVKISQVVIVRIGKGAKLITVYPNPVKDRTLALQFTDMEKGVYHLRLINTAGQQVYNKTINHTGGSAAQTIALPGTLPTGNYLVEIHEPGNVKTTKAIVINE